jgi:hypothetical protein
MSNMDLSNYIEVPERIRDFMEKHPEGSLQCKTVEYRDLPADVSDRHEPTRVELTPHVIYHALAYRSPDDRRPGHGMASEPYPGLTPYTKGSELMNAETSAWGRALAAIGFVSKRDGSAGVATAQEVRARQDSPGRTSEGVTPSKPQRDLLQKLVKEKRATPEQLNYMLIEVGASGVTVGEGWVDKLTGGKKGTCSELIDWLMKRPLPTPENPSDVPGYGEADFTHPPADDGVFEAAA